MMTIEQTVAIPADYHISLELPRSVPTGVNARVSISIPAADSCAVFDSRSGPKPAMPVKSYRGILKGSGISVQRLRELQREDKAVEDAAESSAGTRQGSNLRFEGSPSGKRQNKG